MLDPDPNLPLVYLTALVIFRDEISIKSRSQIQYPAPKHTTLLLLRKKNFRCLGSATTGRKNCSPLLILFPCGSNQPSLGTQPGKLDGYWKVQARYFPHWLLGKCPLIMITLRNSTNSSKVPWWACIKLRNTCFVCFDSHIRPVAPCTYMD